MTDLVYFFGRFHVLLVHLPIGILLLAVLLELLSRRDRFRSLAPAVTFVWLCGAATAVVAVLLGLMHATEGGFDAHAVAAHRNAGTTLAALSIAIWWLRSKANVFYAKTWPVFAIAVVASLIVVGHLGGNLTHGDTYLAQYAPGLLQPLFGASPEQLARPKPKDVLSADIYLDVVAPSLSQRCGSCHNDNKRKGGLSVATYTALMKGGENGKVVTPNDLKGSDLYRRITLPHDHEDFMPHDGKTPLTPEQTAAIGWWISIGAPRTGIVASLQPAAETMTALNGVLGFGGTKSIAVARPDGDVLAKIPGVVAPDKDTIAAVESKGFIVRQIAAGSPLVSVDFAANRKIVDDDIAELQKLAVQIYELNLHDAGVTDAQLQTIAKLSNLARLRLELNPITDAGVEKLVALGNLEYLNLYGTKVGDKSLQALANLTKLSTLYVWQTSVSADAIAKFERGHAETTVDNGFGANHFRDAPKSIPVIN